MLLPEGGRAGGGSGVPFVGYFFLSPDPLVTRGLVLLLLNPRQSTPRLALVFCGLCSSPAALPWGGSELLWCRGGFPLCCLHSLHLQCPAGKTAPGWVPQIVRQALGLLLLGANPCLAAGSNTDNFLPTLVSTGSSARSGVQRALVST